MPASLSSRCRNPLKRKNDIGKKWKKPLWPFMPSVIPRAPTEPQMAEVA